MKLFIPSFSFHFILFPFYLFIYFFASLRACVVAVVYDHTTTTPTPAYPSLQHFGSQNNVTREAVHYHSDCNHVTTDLRPLFFPSTSSFQPVTESSCFVLFCFFVFFGLFQNLFAFTILNSCVSYTDFD